MGCPIGQKSFKNPSLKSLKNQILGDFLFDFNKISCEAIPQHIDNTIDNGWILILQQIEIQPFIFLYLCDMIDKAA